MTLYLSIILLKGTEYMKVMAGVLANEAFLKRFRSHITDKFPISKPKTKLVTIELLIKR